MKRILNGFSKVGVIREEDAGRFRNLGVPADRIQVTRNIKYDFPVEDSVTIRKHYQSLLNIKKEKVVVEEEFEDVFGKTKLRQREIKLPKPPGEF